MNEMRKLMESVKQLNEEYVEYHDPDGEFQIIYDFPRGYFAVGKNDAKQDISGESFDNLDDAIEHAEICLSIADDYDGQPSEYEEMQDYMGGDDQDFGQYDESVEVLGETSTGLLAKLKAIVSRHNHNQAWAEDGYYELLDDLQNLIGNAEISIPDNNRELPMMLRTQAD